MDSLVVEIVLKASLTSLASISLLLLPSCVTLSKLLKFSNLQFPYLWNESVVQSCRSLCNCLDRSLSGSPVHGIRQAKILEWVAILFSKGSSQPRDQTRSPPLQADSLPSEPPEKPIFTCKLCWTLASQPQRLFTINKWELMMNKVWYIIKHQMYSWHFEH